MDKEVDEGGQSEAIGHKLRSCFYLSVELGWLVTGG